MSASDRNSRTGYYVPNAARRADMTLPLPSRTPSARMSARGPVAQHLRSQSGFVITAAQVTLGLVSLAVRIGTSNGLCTPVCFAERALW
jgi:hypothetical protein